MGAKGHSLVPFLRVMIENWEGAYGWEPTRITWNTNCMT